MANISDLRADVKLLAHQCPDFTIDKFLVESVRTFCRESWFHQELNTQNIVASTAAYTLTPSASMEVIAVDSVKVDDTPYMSLNSRDINQYPDNHFNNVWTFEPVATLTIYPTPTANVTNGLETKIVIMPTEASTTLPDSVYRHYKQTIVAGALYFILSSQNDAWSNPQLAGHKYREFYDGINKAKMDRIKGFLSHPLSVRPRPFLI